LGPIYQQKKQNLLNNIIIYTNSRSVDRKIWGRVDFDGSIDLGRIFYAFLDFYNKNRFISGGFKMATPLNTPITNRRNKNSLSWYYEQKIKYMYIIAY